MFSSFFGSTKGSHKDTVPSPVSPTVPVTSKKEGSAMVANELKRQLKAAYNDAMAAEKSTKLSEKLDSLMSASKAILSLNIHLMKYLITTQSGATGIAPDSSGIASVSSDTTVDLKSLAKNVDAIFSDTGLLDITHRSAFLPSNQTPLEGIMQLIKANILPSSWLIFYPRHVQKMLNAINKACDTTGKFIYTLPVELQRAVLAEIINFAQEALAHPSASRHLVTQEFYNLFASTRDHRILEQFLSNKEYVESFITAARLVFSKDSIKTKTHYNRACRQGYSFAMSLLNHAIVEPIIIDASFKPAELQAMIKDILMALTAMFEDGGASIKTELARIESADLNLKTLKTDLGYILLQIYQVNKLIERARLALIVDNIPLDKCKEEAIQSKLPLAFKCIARFAPAALSASGAGVSEARPTLIIIPVVTLFDRIQVLQSTADLSKLLCASLSLTTPLPPASAASGLSSDVASVMQTKSLAVSAADSTPSAE